MVDTLPCFKIYLDWRLQKNDFERSVLALLGKTLVVNYSGPSHGDILWDAVRRLTGGIQFSPSAIDTAWLCQRKWAFRAIDKAPKESTEAARLGDATHKVREDWLLHAVEPPNTPAGKLARVGIDSLPPPGFAMVEQIMKLPVQGKRYSISGRIDFFVPNVLVLANGAPVSHPRLWGTRGIPLVGDHKTAGVKKDAPKDAPIRDWGKTAEDLADKDAQASCYGAWGMAVTGASEVDLHWSYMIKSDPPKPRQVNVRLNREHVARNFRQNILPTADHLLTILETPGMVANKVEGNADACEAFGGCPYLDRCTITKDERLRALFMSNSIFPQPPSFQSNFQQPPQQQQPQQQQLQGFQQQQQPPPFSAGPATGQLNAMLDQTARPMLQQQAQQAVQATPQPSDYGYAALKIKLGQAFSTQDSPAVLTAGQWLQQNPDRVQEMLQYAPSSASPPAPPAMPPPVAQPSGPPGWQAVPGQPSMLQATPNIVGGDAAFADVTSIVPEEKKRKTKATAGADLTTTQIVLLGRLADTGDRIAAAFERIAAALERPR